MICMNQRKFNIYKRNAHKHISQMVENVNFEEELRGYIILYIDGANSILEDIASKEGLKFERLEYRSYFPDL